MRGIKTVSRSALPLLAGAAVVAGLAFGAPVALADGGHKANQGGKAHGAATAAMKSCAVGKVVAAKGAPAMYYAVKAPRMSVPEVGYQFDDGVYRMWVPAIGNSVEGPRFGEGTEICVGDEVRNDTGSSLTVKFADGAVAVVGPRTSLKVAEYVVSPNTGADTDLRTVSAQLILNYGQVRTVVPALRPGSNWIVSTTQSRAHVAGYNYTATAADWMTQEYGSTTEIYVNSGDVVVTGKGGGVAAVGKGYGTTISEWALINHFSNVQPKVPVVGPWPASKLAAMLPLN